MQAQSGVSIHGAGYGSAWRMLRCTRIVLGEIQEGVANVKAQRRGFSASAGAPCYHQLIVSELPHNNSPVPVEIDDNMAFPAGKLVGPFFQVLSS